MSGDTMTAERHVSQELPQYIFTRGFLQKGSQPVTCHHGEAERETSGNLPGSDPAQPTPNRAPNGPLRAVGAYSRPVSLHSGPTTHCNRNGSQRTRSPLRWQGRTGPEQPCPALASHRLASPALAAPYRPVDAPQSATGPNHRDDVAAPLASILRPLRVHPDRTWRTAHEESN